MEKQDHWQRIYADKRPTNLSWFKKHLQKSLELIDHARLKQEAHIIDWLRHVNSRGRFNGPRFQKSDYFGSLGQCVV